MELPCSIQSVCLLSSGNLNTLTDHEVHVNDAAIKFSDILRKYKI